MRLVRRVQLVILFQISTYFLALTDDGPCSCELDEIACGDPHHDPETIKGIDLQDNDLALKQAKKNAWPWLVSLRRKGTDGMFRHECGGTLVSPTIVISAAHCLTNSDDVTDFEIELAPHSLSHTNRDGLVKVKQFLPHDILIITLDKPVPYNDVISPACFGVDDYPAQEAECYAVGWGKYVQDRYTKPTNDILVQLFSMTFEGQYCRTLMGVNRTEFNSETMTCSPLGQHKTCHVDSGGPLMCKVNGIWRLYGVLNSAHKCTQDNSVATYSMIKRYWKFLVDNIVRTNRPSPPPTPVPKITITALSDNMSPLNEEHCGDPDITPYTEQLNTQRRMIGGNEAKRNSWPWQVSVRFKGDDGVFRHKCGGTLVSKRKVISAAHCIAFSEIATDYEVQLGAHVLSETNKEGLVKVGKIDLPIGDNAKKQEYPSDIMVITLAHPVTYNDKISPACFGSANIELDKVVCYVTGWGTNVSHNSIITSNLKQLRVPIHKQEDCKKYIGNDFDPNLMMCAGSLTGDSDTCQGDSGGPLVCKVDKKWNLYGVVIFGKKKCAERNSPTVYAKVNAHWKFLREAVNKLNSD